MWKRRMSPLTRPGAKRWRLFTCLNCKNFNDASKTCFWWGRVLTKSGNAKMYMYVSEPSLSAESMFFKVGAPGHGVLAEPQKAGGKTKTKSFSLISVSNHYHKIECFPIVILNIFYNNMLKCYLREKFDLIILLFSSIIC